jgi:capsule polysaccharide export protein KpsE/RkpR
MDSDMPDLTLEVLKDIRSELREMKTDLRELRSEMTSDIHGLKAEVHELRTEMHDGFQTLSTAIITGFVENEHEHTRLEARVARIEAHLKLAP